MTSALIAAATLASVAHPPPGATVLVGEDWVVGGAGGIDSSAILLGNAGGGGGAPRGSGDATATSIKAIGRGGKIGGGARLPTNMNSPSRVAWSAITKMIVTERRVRERGGGRFMTGRSRLAKISLNLHIIRVERSRGFQPSSVEDVQMTLAQDDHSGPTKRL